LKSLFALCLIYLAVAVSAQKRVYDVELFGKKIGSTVIERTDKGNGETEYKLSSSSRVSLLFTTKSSDLNFDVIYKNGILSSSYYKNVKDDVTEIATVAYDGVKYIIHKGQDVLTFAQPIDFSIAVLYFVEPIGRPRIFSERLGQFVNFKPLSKGVYQCVLDNGVSNIYKYSNGVLYELEISKGASVLMKLVK
jgi:hypothetical protein